MPLVSDPSLTSPLENTTVSTEVGQSAAQQQQVTSPSSSSQARPVFTALGYRREELVRLLLQCIKQLDYGYQFFFNLVGYRRCDFTNLPQQ